MTATVAMVATAALTTHFMLRIRCVSLSLCISFSIIWHFSSFSNTKEIEEKKSENRLILLVVSSLQFLFCDRYNNASGSDPPSPPPPPPAAPNKRRPLHAFLIKMANVFTHIDAHAGAKRARNLRFLSCFWLLFVPDRPFFVRFVYFRLTINSALRNV